MALLALAFLASAFLFAPPAEALISNTYSTDLESGNSQYWSVADGAQSGLDFSGDFTIAMWAKPESQPPSGTSFNFVRKYLVSGDQRSYLFRYSDSGVGSQFLASFTSSNGQGGTETGDGIAQTLSNDTWYHVVLSKDDTVSTVYVNGSSIGTVPATATVFNGAAPFEVGADSVNGEYVDGKINDLRVWSRALSGGEVASLYANSCTFDNGANIVSTWFTSNTGDDFTGPNDLSNNNSATFSTDVPFGCAPVPTISYFTATPSSITSGQSSTLAWNVSSSTSVTIDNGIGSVSASSTTSVSPTVTTVYTLTASNQGLATSTEMVTVTVAVAAEAVRKSADESVTSNTTLQNDDQLALSVMSGKTYLVEGVIFATSTSATPDIKIALTTPGGSSLAAGYMSAAGSVVDGGMLQSSGVSSGRIQIPANTPMPIIVRGTLVTTNSGTLRLQWAQFASNAAAVTIGQGSYLKVEEI